jgi:mRNA interferase RelE/StbE
MYKILISNRAIKDLQKLDNNIYLKISDKIISLENNPRPIGSIKLTDDEGYRIRIRTFRILYKINDNQKKVIIYKISHRKDVYR